MHWNCKNRTRYSYTPRNYPEMWVVLGATVHRLHRPSDHQTDRLLAPVTPPLDVHPHISYLDDDNLSMCVWIP
jgi:hypothetical protein